MMNVGIGETHAEHKKRERRRGSKRKEAGKPKSNEGDWDSTYKDESKLYKSDSNSDSRDSDAGAIMKKRAKPTKKKKKRSRIVHTCQEDLDKDCVGQAKRGLEFFLSKATISALSAKSRKIEQNFNQRLYWLAGTMACQHVVRRWRQAPMWQRMSMWTIRKSMVLKPLVVDVPIVPIKQQCEEQQRLGWLYQM
jgi:hypothetical protein